MNAPAAKSPNVKRLDEIDRMIKEIGRETDKFEREQAALIADRDQWKAGAEALKRERDAAFERVNAAEARIAAVLAALGIADQPAPIAEPAPAERGEVADKLAGLSGAEAEAKLREITGDSPKPPRRRVPRAPDAPQMAEPLAGLAEEIDRLNTTFPETAPAEDTAAEFDRLIIAFWQGDKQPLSDAEIARLREIATTGLQTDALANVLEATGQLEVDDEGTPIVAPDPSPTIDTGLADMMAAIERVTGKSAKLAPAKPTVRAVKAEAPAEPAPASRFDSPFPEYGIPPMLDENDNAIFRALVNASKDRPGDFLKVSKLHAYATLAGYTLTEAALRFRMKLSANPLAKSHAHLIEEQASPLAWRLRQPSPDGGDKIDIEAPAKPEPSRALKLPKVPKSFPELGEKRDTGLSRNVWAFRHRKDSDGPVELPKCQVCGRALKANNGIVQDHGHKRGEGYNDGPCAGSYEMPIQVDFSMIVRLIEVYYPERIKSIRSEIDKSPEGVNYYNWAHGWKFVTPANFNDLPYARFHDGYEGFRLVMVKNWDHQIEQMLARIEDAKERLAKWTPKPFKIDGAKGANK